MILACIQVSRRASIKDDSFLNEAIARPLFLSIKQLHLSENTVEKLQEDVLNSLKDRLIKKILSMLYRIQGLKLLLLGESCISR
jgi:hypothetical protein